MSSVIALTCIFIILVGEKDFSYVKPPALDSVCQPTLDSVEETELPKNKSSQLPPASDTEDTTDNYPTQEQNSSEKSSLHKSAAKPQGNNNENTKQQVKESSNHSVLQQEASPSKSTNELSDKQVSLQPEEHNMSSRQPMSDMQATPESQVHNVVGAVQPTSDDTTNAIIVSSRIESDIGLMDSKEIADLEEPASQQGKIYLTCHDICLCIASPCTMNVTFLRFECSCACSN